MRHPDQITEIILREAIAIHRALGPGAFESSYEAILADSLASHGLVVDRQVVVPVTYNGRTIAEGYRIDLLVEQQVVVECKSLEKLAPIHTQQVLTYLRLGGFQLGLLLNFGAPMLKDGIKRVVNSHATAGGSPLRANRQHAETLGAVSA